MNELLKRLELWEEKFGSQTRIVIYSDGSGHIQASNIDAWGIPSDDTRVASFSDLYEFLSMPINKENT